MPLSNKKIYRCSICLCRLYNFAVEDIKNTSPWLSHVFEELIAERSFCGLIHEVFHLMTRKDFYEAED